MTSKSRDIHLVSLGYFNTLKRQHQLDMSNILPVLDHEEESLVPDQCMIMSVPSSMAQNPTHLVIPAPPQSSISLAPPADVSSSNTVAVSHRSAGLALPTLTSPQVSHND